MEEYVLGAGDDLQIYHNGTENIIATNNSVVLQIRCNGTEKAIEVNPNGNVELYYDHSQKFETTSSGISVTGGIVGSTDATINSITVGKGANSVSGNTVLGEGALDASVTGGNNTAVGENL